MSGATIGQHVRHILEFYQCLLNGKANDVICYDGRRRDSRIETDRSFASHIVGEFLDLLVEVKEDRCIVLKGNYSTVNNNEINLTTSLFRELAYTLEHSIHHQAIIKAGIKSMHRDEILVENFSVAPSTLRHTRGQKNESQDLSALNGLNVTQNFQNLSHHDTLRNCTDAYPPAPKPT